MNRKRTLTPLRYIGGKGLIAPKLIELFPPHKTYVEPFGGGGSVLLSKRPSKVEVYNDIDSQVVNFFRVLKDPVGRTEFLESVSLTPYSREEYLDAYDQLKDGVENPVTRAVLWFIIARQNFAGLVNDRAWGYAAVTNQAAGWANAVNGLPHVVERMRRVQVDNHDFREMFKRYDRPGTLFYCDPPYITETRTEEEVYANEMTDPDHRDLVKLLLNLKGKAVLSGYMHEIYQPLAEAGWSVHEFKTKLYSSASTSLRDFPEKLEDRVEVAWVSPGKVGRWKGRLGGTK